MRLKPPTHQQDNTLTAKAVLSVALPTPMRTGPRYPTLLSGGGYKTALRSATIARSSRDVWRSLRDAREPRMEPRHRAMRRPAQHPRPIPSVTRRQRHSRRHYHPPRQSRQHRANSRLLCTTMTSISTRLSSMAGKQGPIPLPTCSTTIPHTHRHPSPCPSSLTRLFRATVP